MADSDALSMLQKCGAFRSGHFVYTSGRHGGVYVAKDALLASPEDLHELCYRMADRFILDKVDVVAGPAVAAAVISQVVAYQLGRLSGRPVRATYADKTAKGGFEFRRGYAPIVRGRRVLVVEDLVTTGGSLMKVVEAVRGVGGEVVGAGVLCNRGKVAAADIGDVPKLVSLAEIELTSWAASECFLCKQGVPIDTEHGHGKEFLAELAVRGAAEP